MAFLKVIRGAIPGQILELYGERMVMGRHPNCQIVLDNAAVSRHHAQVVFEGGRYFIEDLNSRNGTFLNEQPITGKVALNHGDRLRICDTTLTFHQRAEVPAGSSVNVRSGDVHLMSF